MAQSALAHPISRGAVIFSEEIFLQGTCVDSDADRNFALGGEFNYLLNAPAGADIAGVKAEPVHPLFQGDEGEFVIKMNVRDERDTDLLLDLPESLCRFPDGNRHPYNITARYL